MTSYDLLPKSGTARGYLSRPTFKSGAASHGDRFLRQWFIELLSSKTLLSFDRQLPQ